MNTFYPRPTRSMVYLLDLVFVAVLICSKTQSVIGSLPRIADAPPDEQASAMKINAPTSAELTPPSINAMKKPCLLYYIEYGKYFNETAAGLDTLTDNPWVCELDAEDRIAYNSFLIVQVDGLDNKALTLCSDSKKVVSGSCVVSGQSLLYSPYAEVNQKSIKFHPKHPPKVIPPPHSHEKRNLAATVGNRTVVVLRVIALDSATNYTAAELFDRVFNTSVLSLRSGYDACSYGQLIFKPSTHALAVNGVVNVTISMNAKGTEASTIENAVKTAANSALGDLPSQFDHVMIALPPGVVINGKSFTSSYAYVGSYISVYPNRQIGLVGTTMHEIGHNLNLQHSGEGPPNVYGDQTCFMGGNSYPTPYFPKMCFNGAKSFNFGWYSPRTTTINVFTADTSAFTTQYSLIGVADYQNANNDASSLVVVKLETGSTDYYIYYNRKTGINAEVQEYGDYVMVVSQGDNPSISWVVAKFKTAGNMTIANVGGSIHDITIVVNSINLQSNPAKANITISRTLSTQSAPGLDDSTLPGAVSLWISNKTLALTTYGNISSWNTVNVTTLHSIFDNQISFNEDISTWNVGKVTSMYAAFCNASMFNSSLLNWNVSSVTDVSWAFAYATKFNGDVSQWNMRSARNMARCFYYAQSFNQDVSKWNISSVTDLNWGFAYAESFNGNLSFWNTANVRDMSKCFYAAKLFNRDLSKWSLSSVSTMNWMFGGASIFNQDVSSWSVSKVTDMNHAFYYAGSFNSRISVWNVTAVTDFSFMFFAAAKFNQSVCWNIAGKVSKSMFNSSSGSIAPASCKFTSVPTKSPSAKPSRKPTAAKTKNPTKRPSGKPSRKPTFVKTKNPTKRPSAKPSRKPTAVKTKNPTKRPSGKPSRKPTKRPSAKPSRKPTAVKTKNPTKRPSRKPSRKPTFVKTKNPTKRPSAKPSRKPTAVKTKNPTKRPSGKPSRKPTFVKTKNPTKRPSAKPSHKPTVVTTKNPTKRPSMQPTAKPS